MPESWKNCSRRRIIRSTPTRKRRRTDLVVGPFTGSRSIALTRGVSAAFADCQLEYLPRQEIDVARAIDQHRGYESVLRELGVQVVSLPALTEFPDALFLGDPALVLAEVAVDGAKTKGDERGTL